MGLQIIIDDSTGIQAFMCNTTDVAFGPVFQSDESAEEFLDWLGTDPRGLEDAELSSKVNEWREVSRYAKWDTIASINDSIVSLIERTDIEEEEQTISEQELEVLDFRGNGVIVGFMNVKVVAYHDIDSGNEDTPPHSRYDRYELLELAFSVGSDGLELTEAQNAYLMAKIQE